MSTESERTRAEALKGPELVTHRVKPIWLNDKGEPSPVFDEDVHSLIFKDQRGLIICSFSLDEIRAMGSFLEFYLSVIDRWSQVSLNMKKADRNNHLIIPIEPDTELLYNQMVNTVNQIITTERRTKTR